MAVGVSVGFAVSVGVAVGVSVGRIVAVAVGDGVIVGVLVGVLVIVGVGPGVDVLVGVGVGVGVGVALFMVTVSSMMFTGTELPPVSPTTTPERVSGHVPPSVPAVKVIVAKVPELETLPPAVIITP